MWPQVFATQAVVGVASSTSSRGGGRRGLPSLYTPAELRAWRRNRHLKVREMALLLGWPVSTLSKKLGGHLALTLDVDRQLEGIDAQVARGVVPTEAPIWLAVRIVAGFGWHYPGLTAYAPENSTRASVTERRNPENCPDAGGF